MNFLKGHVLLLQWVLLLIISSMLLSCKKDTDDSPPSIKFIQPGQFEEFEYTEPISIKADISDDEIIQEVNVCIVNQDFTPVSFTESFQPLKNSFRLHYLRKADTNLLQSDYFIRIKAFDGKNWKVKHQPIRINPPPRIFLKCHFATYNNNLITNFTWTASQQPLIFNSIQSDYSAAVVNNVNQQLITGGRYTGSVYSYHLNGKNLNWNIAAQTNLPFPWLMNIKTHQDLVYLCYYDSSIKIINKNGSNIGQLNLPQGMIPYNIFVLPEYYAVYCKLNAGLKDFLFFYHRSTLVKNMSFSMHHPVVDIYPYKSGNYLLFQNTEQGGLISELNPVNGTTTDIYSYTLDHIYQVKSIDNQNYALATSGGLKHYNSTSSSAVTMYGNSNTYGLTYEPLNNLIYVYENNKVSVLKYPDYSLQKTHITTDSIVAINLIYNR